MSERLRALLPEAWASWLEPLLEPSVLLLLGALSVVTFFAGLLGVPFFLVRLREDFFTQPKRSLSRDRLNVGRLVVRVLKNLLGLILLGVGLVTLVLPGQGLLTLFVALLLLDFPGKRGFERRLIGQPRVLDAINRLRRRAGRGPLLPRGSWGPPPPPSAERH